MASCAATLAIGISTVVHPLPRLIWNASASVPIGLYLVQPINVPQVNELVVVRAPPALADFMADRGYLPHDVPLLKHVVALPGQTVCRAGSMITVDGTTVGMARMRDGKGRDLPAWHGCRAIAGDEVFLMNRGAADPFDSRYFGPISVSAIVGRACPVWTEQAP
jgi:conjugative transfer signal peptidase TraF